jgi:hypothetical protein
VSGIIRCAHRRRVTVFSRCEFKESSILAMATVLLIHAWRASTDPFLALALALDIVGWWRRTRRKLVRTSVEEEAGGRRSL